MYRLDLANTLPDGQHIEDYARAAGVKLTGHKTLEAARAAAHHIEQYPDDDGNRALCDVIDAAGNIVEPVS